MASIEKRGENSYRIIVSKPKTNGKGYDKEAKTVTLPPNMTAKQKEKELERLALLFEEDVKKGDYLDGEKVTLAEFVSEVWMKDYAEKELAAATLPPYRLRLEKRILPALGHMKLSRIQPQHIMSFYNNLTEDGVRLDTLYIPKPEFLSLIEGMSHKSLGEKTGVYRKTFARMVNGKGIYKDTAKKLCDYFDIAMSDYFDLMETDKTLSYKTIQHHHNLLSGILSFAVECNLIKDNPAHRVKLNRITKAKSTPVQYYDDRQVLDLFMALENEPIKYKVILFLAIDSGLRLGEVAGLEWSFIDLDNKILNVVKQRQYVSGKGVIEGDPKSEKSIRKISISNTVSCILKNYKKYQTEMRLKCGSEWYQGDKVFTHEDGRPIFPNRPSIWFSEFIKRKGLPHITFHGLRHTNASLLIAEDTDIVTLSVRLGHANKKTTLDVYSHVIKSREKLAANKMDNFYERMKTPNANSDNV